MKNLKYVLICILVVLTIVGLLSSGEYSNPQSKGFARGDFKPVSICADFSVNWLDTTTTARILPGLGNLQYRITTPSAKAQEFFNQGIRLVYAFNHWEAIQAFRAVVKEDPNCAMGYWGLALAYGPNLNDVTIADREKIAFGSIQKALDRSGRSSAAEKGLIHAMAARYDGNVHEVRDSLNRSYADAMIELSEKFPDDAEVLTLCADAIMNTMPWDYWQPGGSPKQETQLAKDLLEKILKKFPAHPGAHHLYIHLVEASPNPELALGSAKFLEKAMPRAGHLVHMPAHIYFRVGNYSRSIDLNIQAAKVDEEYLSTSNNQGMYRMMYYPHNVDFISYGSLMEGRSNLSIQTALKMAYKGNLMMNVSPGFGQYLNVEPMLAFVRFGKWTDILSLSAPDEKQIYTNIIWRFARGMAFVRSNEVALAEKELTTLDSLVKMDTLKSIYFSFNPVSEITKIPLNILRGEVFMKQKKFDKAVNAFNDAILAENGLRYNEPPDWKLPARHFLGAALLESAKFAEAEKVFLEDLKKNPENGWSLKGLSLALEKLGRKADAAAMSKRFDTSWKNADVKISSSRYY
jgi:tetratricopeptide (TPR) repeat protein